MKTVVIASGKGGTGKTTLTALFAHLAAHEMAVVVADTDVEASNLPIALHVHRSACTSFAGGQTARVDAARCEACGLCAEVCRFDALCPDPTTDAYSVDLLACEGCGSCVRVCPFGALTMSPSTAGRACTGTGTVGPIAYGQLGPGEDLSGKLVTEVRSRGKAAAERHAAALMLIDGPPGIGCPVIAAMTNTDLLVAVAEPTLSGEHDLSRLIDLAGRFDLPIRVVLNKSDLSIPGATRVRALCETRHIPLLAEIPFDPSLAQTLEHLAARGADKVLGNESVGVRAVAQVWKALRRDLDLA